jgi:hypothetical protein
MVSNSTTYAYCASFGPVELTMNGDSVYGRYLITVTPEPIPGKIYGRISRGLLDGTWSDRDGTGRILFAFTTGYSRFTAVYNTSRNPSNWNDGIWKGVNKNFIDEIPEDKRKDFLCEWK